MLAGCLDGAGPSGSTWAPVHGVSEKDNLGREVRCNYARGWGNTLQADALDTGAQFQGLRQSFHTTSPDDGICEKEKGSLAKQA